MLTNTETMTFLTKWAPVIALVLTICSATWFLATRMATTKADVDTIRGTVAGLDQTVEDLGGTVGNLEEAVGDLHETVSDLKVSAETLGTLDGTVRALNGTVEAMRGTVQKLDASMDTLNVGLPLLVACVVDLHGPWTPGGVDERPHRQGRGDDIGNFNAPPRVFRLPGSCEMAQQRLNRQPRQPR